ncbi:hypothetical protein [Brevibacterium aurantiacum]|uniref:hypothetical protein n=1 Tax=Brevibacterium aurantiacum TaxID=273384 RepID=UPI001865D239|nr:hypothetical protein [Brevibacterium aurantiacum]
MPKTSSDPEESPHLHPRRPNELVDLTGWHREYARAALKTALTPTNVKPKLGRAPIYTPDLMLALITCWCCEHQESLAME